MKMGFHLIGSPKKKKEKKYKNIVEKSIHKVNAGRKRGGGIYHTIK